MTQEPQIRADLLQTIREFVATRGVDPVLVSEASSLADDLELDSLDLMALAQRWEQDYTISIVDNEKVLDITTVGQVLDFVIDQTRARGEVVR